MNGRAGFKELLLKADRIHRKAELRSETSAYDISQPNVRGSKPGSSHLSFGRDDMPLAVEIERGLARMLDVWQASLDGADPSRPAKGDRVGPKTKVRNKAILECRGMDPTAVAFIHGMSTEAVRRVRERHDFDAATGMSKSELLAERVDGKPTSRGLLTARP